MIAFDGVTKRYAGTSPGRHVLQDATFRLPSDRPVALLGGNGSGKSTILRMIAGLSAPDRGRIRTRGRVSWPVGFSGSFHPDLSGLQNTRFVARVHGVDGDELVAFVRDFANLGRQFSGPVRSYSSGMRARLAFAVSMGIRFDTYLIDEITAVGDAAFRAGCTAMLRDRLTDSGAIIITHSMAEVRALCTSVAVLSRGEVRLYADVEAGIAAYRAAA